MFKLISLIFLYLLFFLKKNKNYFYLYIILEFFILLMGFNNLDFRQYSYYHIIVNYLINFNYNLIIILFFICYYLIIFKQNNKIIKSIVLYFIFFIYNDYIINHNNLIILNHSNLNINLTNGLFYIHPLIIYLLYSYIIILFIFNLNLINNQFNKINICKYNIISSIINYNLIIIFIFLSYLVLVLGSIWALQELVWSNWWSWDPIEIINLIIYIYLLKISHKNFLLYYIQSYILNIFILTTIILFISTRYSIFNSIHNFLNIESNYQYFIFIFIIYILLYMFKFIKFIRYNILNIKNEIICNIFNIFNIYLIITLLLLFINIFKIIISLGVFTDKCIFMIMYFIIIIYIYYNIEFNKFFKFFNPFIFLFDFTNFILFINFKDNFIRLYKKSHIIYIFFLILILSNLNKLLIFEFKYLDYKEIVIHHYNNLLFFSYFLNFNYEFNIKQFNTNSILPVLYYSKSIIDLHNQYNIIFNNIFLISENFNILIFYVIKLSNYIILIFFFFKILIIFNYFKLLVI
uniref:Heme maturase n=1 Tax=Ichthyophthirius multifiliis TaxID=5932 RepID=G1FLC9_ICHMU|nr:heme maturase [Ichthyophthirius multifiliis]AEL89271.1 heme maturase [Ichthyophthirius multifiliis]